MLFFGLFSCHPQEDAGSIALNWIDSRAVGVSIPTALLADIPRDSIDKWVSIRILSKDAPAIMGRFDLQDEILFFNPLIPFTRGMTYRVLARDRTVGEFEILDPDPSEAPRLLAIYPSVDTVPENLLKMYLHFSQPMRERHSLEYVKVIREGEDTVDVFLDLQPELWDQESEQLTLWLDPGRIKRDLLPNQLLGIPIEEGNVYSILVSNEWPDQQGNFLQQSYSRQLVVGQRDSLPPDPTAWHLSVPAPSSRDPLIVAFGESLDIGLLKEAFQVFSSNGKRISVATETGDKQDYIRLIPDESWDEGNYFLRIESDLEDLAGNNLNRPFDRDILTTPLRAPQDYYDVGFIVSSIKTQ